VPGEAAASAKLTVEQVVAMALDVNSQVRSAQARWSAAEHQILPNYVPADPTVTYTNAASATNGISHPADLSFTLNQSLQAPGKGILQGRSASRTAQIARLTYEAARRDVRAQAQTAFYQLLLDRALFEVGAENIATLQQVLQVTQVAYSTGRVTQLDFLTGELNLSTAQQQQMRLDTSIATDRANLNQLLERDPEEPLEIDGQLDLQPIAERIEDLVAAASTGRQEILEAALAAENSQTAVMLAKLEYVPDFSLGFSADRFQLASAAPDNTHLQTYSLSLGMNVPVFAWFHQREDVESAKRNLEAARSDLRFVRLQAGTQVTIAYRQMDLAYRAAVLYRDSLVPLARQGVNVALVAYQGGRIDFIALSNALQQRNMARVTYLQLANEFLAQRIVLEQAIGRPLTQ
jgi:outer membrane protein, heavy metal efflux system